MALQMRLPPSQSRSVTLTVPPPSISERVVLKGSFVCEQIPLAMESSEGDAEIGDSSMGLCADPLANSHPTARLGARVQNQLQSELASTSQSPEGHTFIMFLEMVTA